MQSFWNPAIPDRFRKTFVLDRSNWQSSYSVKIDWYDSNVIPSQGRKTAALRRRSIARRCASAAALSLLLAMPALAASLAIARPCVIPGTLRRDTMAGICDPVAVAAASVDGVCVATAGRAILHVCVRLPMVPGEHNAGQAIARTPRAERDSREKITFVARAKRRGAVQLSRHRGELPPRYQLQPQSACAPNTHAYISGASKWERKRKKKERILLDVDVWMQRLKSI